DRIVTAHHLRDDRLRSDPIGADRQTDAITDIDDIGEITDVQTDSTHTTRHRPGLLDARNNLVKAGLRLLGVDAGAPIEPVLGCHSTAPVTLLLCAIRREEAPRVN